MSPLEQHRQQWRTQLNIDAHRALWDSEAAHYGARAIASIESDPFMATLAQCKAFNKNSTVLDIGCGAGLYTLACAPYVHTVTGTDLSAEMIAQARTRAQALHLTNCTFECANWSADEAPECARAGGYDIVFAHFTPAVSTLAGFERFLACAKQWAFYETFIGRRHPLMELAADVAGLPQTSIWDDEGFYRALKYLFLRGLRPTLSYRDCNWGGPMTPEQATRWCTSRLALRMPVDDALKRAVQTAFEARAKEGVLDTQQTGTIVTVSVALS